MKTIKLFSIMALAMAVACTKVEMPQEQPEESLPNQNYTTITVGIADDASKTHFGGKEGQKLLWSEGDAIAVSQNGKTLKYVLSSGKATQKGTFVLEGTDEGIDFSQEVTVTYPYTADGKIVVPTEQTRSGNNFDPAAAIMSYTGSVDNISLKNLTSMICLSLIAETKTIVAVDAVVGETTYTIDCGSLVVYPETAKAKKFYFVIPAQDTAVPVKFIIKEKDNAMAKAVKPRKYAAGHVAVFPVLNYTSYAVGDLYPNTATGKENAEGVVFQHSQNGVKIVSLDAYTGVFTPNSYKELGETIRGTKASGPDNLETISKWPDFTKNNYPAVHFCTAKGDGWYLPTISEYKTILNNKDKFDKNVVNWVLAKSKDDKEGLSSFFSCEIKKPTLAHDNKDEIRCIRVYDQKVEYYARYGERSVLPVKEIKF